MKILKEVPNVYRLDATVKQTVDGMRNLGIKQSLIDWAERTIRKTVRSSTWYNEVSQIGLGFRYVVSRSEYRMLEIDYELNASNQGYRQHTWVLSNTEMETYPWLRRALDNGDNLVIFGDLYKGSPDIWYQNDHLIHLTEALEYWHPDMQDYSDFTLDAATNLSEKRQKDLERKARDVEGQIRCVGQITSVIDGMLQVLDIIEMMDNAANMREGWRMHHCVGNYVPLPTRRFYSIRTMNDEPLATVEVAFRPPEWNIIQIKGPFNQPVSNDLGAAIRAWVWQNIHQNKAILDQIIAMGSLSGVLNSNGPTFDIAIGRNAIEASPMGFVNLDASGRAYMTIPSGMVEVDMSPRFHAGIDELILTDAAIEKLKRRLGLT